MHNKQFQINFCTYFNSKPKFTYNSETYNDTVIFCVYSGSFSYKINNGAEHQISGGQAVICPPNNSFQRKMIVPASFCMIRLSVVDFLYVSHMPVTFTDSSRFFSNLEKLKNCSFVSNPESDDYVNHFCRDIWYQIIDELKPAKPLGNIIDYINSHYSENLSIENLAKETGYSTVHFINTFKKHYGYSPKQYIESLRLSKAQNLIKTTELSFGEISALCGIKDEFYFSRFFKNHCGITPTEFKKLNRI